MAQKGKLECRKSGWLITFPLKQKKKKIKNNKITKQEKLTQLNFCMVLTFCYYCLSAYLISFLVLRSSYDFSSWRPRKTGFTE